MRTDQCLHEFSSRGNVEEFFSAERVIHGFTETTEVIKDLKKEKVGLEGVYGHEYA